MKIKNCPRCNSVPLTDFRIHAIIYCPICGIGLERNAGKRAAASDWNHRQGIEEHKRFLKESEE